MSDLSPVILGITFLVLGTGFVLLTLLALRWMPKMRPLGRAATSAPPKLPLPEHEDAVVLVQSGGRVTYINLQARELFNLWEEEPNIENLARRTRPSETFLMLCASEGQARFSLNGRFVEGTSYFAPGMSWDGTGGNNAILVSIRRPQITIEGESRLARVDHGDYSQPASDGVAAREASGAQFAISSQAFGIFTELSQAMAGSLELETTLQTILESVERLIPSDFLEITIWEPEQEHLIPYRLMGIPGIDRRLEKSAERYHPRVGYSGHLIETRQPLLVEDVNTFRQARPGVDRQRFPFQSYLGVPMLLAGDFVGTVELASLLKESYTDSDLEVLRLLSGQAVIALNNALLYQQEQERAKELAGLAGLAQVTSAIRDPLELYTRLVESISPLIQVEILGFLIYDESLGILEGQNPFQGIPAEVLEWYHSEIGANEQAAEIWASGEMIVSSNAPEDTRLQAFDLHNLAQAAGVIHAALAPLSVAGNMFGYLMVGDKLDGTPFDQNDMRFLSIVSGQAATIIENAALVQQSRKRTQRAETLRRIASLTSSTATLDEILKYSLVDLARLLGADLAAIYLIDESRGELRLHNDSLFGVSQKKDDLVERILIEDIKYPQTVTGSRTQFISSDISEESELSPIYQRLGEKQKMRSVVGMALIMRERSIGEILIGSQSRDFFSPGDIQTIATAVVQLAAAIEQSTLYTQTDQSLRQRVDELTALTRISRELNTTLNLEPILQKVYNEVLRTTRADCGTILLFELKSVDEPNTGTELLVSSEDQFGKPPDVVLHLGDPPEDEELHPLEVRVLAEGESIIVEDFAGRSKTGAASQNPAHEGIRSALIVPIAHQGQIAGLIHLHAKKPNHFGSNEREIGEALAIQAAIALGNAKRYEEQQKRGELLNRRVETLSKMFDVSKVLQTEQPLEEALEAIGFAIQAATPFDVVLISIYEEKHQRLVRVSGIGIPHSTMSELRARHQPWSAIQKIMLEDYRMGRTYFIPSEESHVLPEDLHTVVISENGSPGEVHTWKAEDIFILPLMSSTGEPLGLISVDSPRDNMRPDQPTIESLEILGSQAALIIEGQQKVRRLREQVEDIQSELELAQEKAVKAQSHLPVLLHKDLEQSLAIRALKQRSQRIHAGLDIAEIINQQNSRIDVLSILGKETLKRMEFDVVMVADQLRGDLNLNYSIGRMPEGVNPEALLGQRNPLRHCLQTGESLLISNLDDEEYWQKTPLLRALEAKSFVCLPISENGGGYPTSVRDDEGQWSNNRKNGNNAVMLAVSKTQTAPYSEQDRQLFELMSRQVSIALQNLNLLEDTKRRLQEVNLLMKFSQRLGSLEPSSILQALIESALSMIPAAQSGVVVLWDSRHGMLVPQVASGYTDDHGLMDVRYRPGEGLPGQVFEQRRAIRLDEVDFTRHYNLTPENLNRYRDATGGMLPVSSVAVPIMAGVLEGNDPETTRFRHQDSGGLQMDMARAVPLGVLVLDNAKTTAAFNDDDLAVISSLAQQTALTLENASLYQASEQRSNQLQALTNVATTITASLQPDELIDTLLDQLQAILPYDTGTLWLRLDDGSTHRDLSRADWMVVRAARGFEDSDERIGLTVNIEDSQLLKEMFQTGKPIWVANVQKDARFRAITQEGYPVESDNTFGETAESGYEHLSWLGVPLISSGEVVGVIALEKTEANFYSTDDIQVAVTFAGQIAAGLSNARLYQESVGRAYELDQRSQTLTRLHRLSSVLSGSLVVEQILQASVREIAQMIPCTSVSVLQLRDIADKTPTGEENQASRFESSEFVLRAEYSEQGIDESSELKLIGPTPLLDRLSETQSIYSTDHVDQEAELNSLKEFLARYHTHSLLVVPIAGGSSAEGEITTEHLFQGLLLFHNSDPYHYHADEFELARTISNQIAIALHNAGLFEETRSLTDELEIRVQQRTAELIHEQHRVETLLKIFTELSASLDLDKVLHTTLQVLSDYVEAQQITIFIARPGEETLQRLASIGPAPPPVGDGSPTRLGPNEGLAGWIISQRQAVLIEDVERDERWKKIEYPEEERLQYHSAMGVPLMSGAEALGCLLLFHSKSSHFSLDQLDLVQAAANQVSVAVNNAELYRLIRDQAEDLGIMLRNQQVETSRSQAILEDVADGVLVTDANRQITLFNASAEKILGIERGQVLGKSLEQFTGLFGRAAHSWMKTITNWSKETTIYKQGETYIEELSLDDGRVISVRLAPVTLHDDFLGTVSTFQDITHQVEVDRLKSEFVATVSHELRTPMTSIKGYVEVLLMGAAGKLSEQQDHFLQIVRTNIDRLTVLVNDLLDVSQIETGRLILSLQPVDCEEIVDSALEYITQLAKEDEKPVVIKKDVQPGLPRVQGDPDRIRQIFDNLLDNAYQYNTSQGTIQVSIHQEKDFIQIDVKDSGVGIHPDDFPHVFERFFRGDNPLVLGVSGSGLGLAIVKRLVEMHDGRIWFESTGIPGEGSIFSFTLPVYVNE